jgi:2-dehydro-3-deoxyphosphogluconate aldolase/(4S)-4-hydroxy-2-oxoglutarate aldolase
MMDQAIKKVSEIGILPVINIEDEADALPLAKALRDGGIPAIEVTLRSPKAIKAIGLIKQAYPDMVVAAGTVLQTGQVDQAREAGADYVVAPGYNPRTVAYCKRIALPIIPGCVTASDLEAGIEAGLSVFKFFPAGQLGGLETIKLLGGPFPKLKFIPTGGLNFGNLPAYLENDRIMACGGSFMAKAELIRAGEWDAITALCKQAVNLALGFELAHVGLNHHNTEEALKTARWFAAVFNLTVKDGNSSVFAGKAVECMKTQYLGTRGHIGLLTRSMERAMAHLAGKGITLREDSIKTDTKGKLVSAYLEDEICGFAVHIVRKS